jgi:glycosyltransferase involved in cell wall biosynthesis
VPLSRLLPEYRHDIILKSFAYFKPKGIDFVLTIIGDGTQLSKLKDLAKDLDIENKVNFTEEFQTLNYQNCYNNLIFTLVCLSPKDQFEAMATTLSNCNRYCRK